VGQNHAVRDEPRRAIDIFRLDAAAERRQIERLRAVRAARDAGKVAETLEAVREAAQGTENLVPPILEAVKVFATQGEICDVLREVFGTYHPDTLTSGV
jgi:methylmalonyl-CoA mutase N-terminal domain/subunit